ncbi:flavin-containing superfamily amine oxidase-like protein [Cadophora sp. MPI-SDFR-AT-0126]|nr:flavin-containing superfamily amine oxidase-like protein [Leotiomycetes sp. MPI-SDFR-AT-0126]
MGCFNTSAFQGILAVLIGLIVTLQASASAPVSLNGVEYRVTSTISRDICIVGGGSSGTYAGIRLSDLGKSVVVIEQKGRLGGHTETYTEPISGLKYDIGVEVWHDLPIVKSYFSRLNVSLVRRQTSSFNTKYVDFETGNLASSNVAANLSAGLAAYSAQCAEYPYLEKGFDLPYHKYNLGSMVGFHYRFSQGMGDTLAQPILYVIKNFGSDILRNIQIGFPTTELHDNSLLYEHASETLNGNILLNSRIIKVDRTSEERARIVASTQTGLTLVTCDKLIMAIPPKLENLAGWDLDSDELALFGQFINTGYYTGLLRNTGIPNNVSIVNVSPKAEYNQMVMPGIYNLEQTNIPGLVGVTFGSAHALPNHVVKKQILSDVRRLKYPGKGPSNPQFVVFSRHAPFELTVSTTVIAQGFYKALNDLQGQRPTWYTGAAFHTQDSALIWEFTEALLENITAL